MHIPPLSPCSQNRLTPSPTWTWVAYAEVQVTHLLAHVPALPDCLRSLSSFREFSSLLFEPGSRCQQGKGLAWGRRWDPARVFPWGPGQGRGPTGSQTWLSLEAFRGPPSLSLQLPQICPLGMSTAQITLLLPCLPSLKWNLALRGLLQRLLLI